MLILTRKVNESIVIGSNIEVNITRIEGDVVKVGITAPRKISVYRKELLETVQKTNKEAVHSGVSGDKSSSQNKIKLPPFTQSIVGKMKKWKQSQSSEQSKN